MRSWSRWLGLPVTAAGLLLAAAPPVQAAHDAGSTSGTTVFVQTNDPAGNAIDEFHRNADGTLAFVQSYATGGDGGREVGSMSDPLASQGSLVLVPDAGLLLAVNAGSDTISVFQVAGARLHLEQVLPSNGPFPTAFGVHGSLAYVLDAGGSGFVSGYRIADGSASPDTRLHAGA